MSPLSPFIFFRNSPAVSYLSDSSSVDCAGEGLGVTMGILKGLVTFPRRRRRRRRRSLLCLVPHGGVRQHRHLQARDLPRSLLWPWLQNKEGPSRVDVPCVQRGGKASIIHVT